MSMAHVLQACLQLCSRDPCRVRSAEPALSCATGLPATARERMHLSEVAAVLADDQELAKAHLSDVLHRQPRDVPALPVAHAFNYLTGDVARMKTVWRRCCPHGLSACLVITPCWPGTLSA